MKRSLLTLLAFLVISASALPTVGSAGSASPITLTPIANSGVLVAAGGSKVLIDALFDKPNPEYRAPAADLIDKMMKGAAPFDGVDLVLVTHNHSDHLDPALAVRYLEAQPEASLLAPADAAAEMRKLSADWTKIEPRIIALDLKIGEKAERNIKGITVTAFRTLHGGSATPMNLMYLFEIGGRRIFHEGDSNALPEEWKSFGLGRSPIDLALVHFWFPFVPDRARMLQEDLKLVHIALTHLPIKEEGRYPDMVDKVRTYYRDLILMPPGAPSKILD